MIKNNEKNLKLLSKAKNAELNLFLSESVINSEKIMA